MPAIFNKKVISVSTTLNKTSNGTRNQNKIRLIGLAEILPLLKIEKIMPAKIGNRVWINMLSMAINWILFSASIYTISNLLWEFRNYSSTANIKLFSNMTMPYHKNLSIVIPFFTFSTNSFYVHCPMRNFETSIIMLLSTSII